MFTLSNRSQFFFVHHCAQRNKQIPLQILILMFSSALRRNKSSPHVLGRPLQTVGANAVAARAKPPTRNARLEKERREIRQAWVRRAAALADCEGNTRVMRTYLAVVKRPEFLGWDAKRIAAWRLQVKADRKVARLARASALRKRIAEANKNGHNVGCRASPAVAKAKRERPTKAAALSPQDRVVRALARSNLHRHGLASYGNFVAAHPSETVDTIVQKWRATRAEQRRENSCAAARARWVAKLAESDGYRNGLAAYQAFLNEHKGKSLQNTLTVWRRTRTSAGHAAEAERLRKRALRRGQRGHAARARCQLTEASSTSNIRCHGGIGAPTS